MLTQSTTKSGKANMLKWFIILTIAAYIFFKVGFWYAERGSVKESQQLDKQQKEKVEREQREKYSPKQ